MDQFDGRDCLEARARSEGSVAETKQPGNSGGLMVATKASLGELSSYGVARSTVKGAPLSNEELKKLHAFWRATNYLALGMIYLLDNPPLREKLKPEHIKPRMLGHWGTSPALSFIYAHLNRVIKLLDLDMIYMAGPGHGAPGVLG